MAQESTPRVRIAAAAEREGEGAFVDRCLDVLAGTSHDADLLEILGGTSAPGVLAGREGGPHGYWPRTWALRAFLYVWRSDAEAAVVAAGADEHWRVREMACKVLAKRCPTSKDSEDLLLRLASDPNPRVASAAERALR